MNLETDVSADFENATNELIAEELKKCSVATLAALRTGAFASAYRLERLSRTTHLSTIMHCTLDPAVAERMLAKVNEQCTKKLKAKVNFDAKALARMRDAMLAFEYRHERYLPKHRRWFAAFLPSGACVGQSFSRQWVERVFPRYEKYAFLVRVDYRTEKGGHCIHAVCFCGILFRECRF